MKNADAVIFLNGKIPFKLLDIYNIKENYIICADGAANMLLAHKITPNIIIGDMDSARKDVLKKFRKKGVEIRKIDEQETTDFEKALLYCVENNLKNLLIFGASSKRQDHTLNNYSVLKRYYRILNIKIIDLKFEIFFIDRSITFDYPKGKSISMMPMPVAKGITTKGLKYKLSDEDLEFGIREGTLNTADGNSISIEFKEGDLLLFKRHFFKS